ncbi:response regulator [Geomesophilobacter sediminis]|uniref:Response regulator n=1 Tax=Geomesophilobacter sediminis TaxID=2798584 RepID=A0A8J7M239_9BACT|nr:response regulator [Geomesophilobacter sediminis]MBJ6727153.1 response regulator [Geomesophilobacter sediminis]
MDRIVRILCVDDERNVLRSLQRIFLDDDYEILTAPSGEEGLELLESAGEVQVVISDYRMPGMTGVDFLREVYKRYPETIRIVLSGFADTAAVVAAINEGHIYKFIPKPWDDDEVRFTVAKAIDYYLVQQKNRQLAEELRLKNEELLELNAHLEGLVESRTRELVEQNQALLHARQVLDNLPLGVVAIGMDGTVVQMNRSASAILGVVAAAVRGEHISAVLPWELTEFFANAGRTADGFQRCSINGAAIQVSAVNTLIDQQVGVVLTLVDCRTVCEETAKNGL